MDPGYWETPITYEEDARGGFRTIRSTEQAARALLTKWPADHGREYSKAKRIFLAVMEGKKKPAAARSAFIKAAAEAGVFIREQ